MAKKIIKADNGMNIPNYAIDRIARCMLPMIQKYYDTDEGQRELAEWKEKRKVEKPNKKQP